MAGRNAEGGMQVLKAAAVYFGLIYAVGIFLGPIREEWAVPHFGPIGGLLLEAAVMLPAMIAAAGWIIHRFEVPAKQKTRLNIGFAALGFLLVAEVLGAVLLRGMSVQSWLASYGSVPGLISLILFVVFALMPSLIRA